MRNWFAIVMLALCGVCFGVQKVTYNEATELAVGPFYDATDGVTPETALTVTNYTVYFYHVTDANSITTESFVPSATATDPTLMVHISGGMYNLRVPATYLDVYGRCRMVIQDTDGATIPSTPYIETLEICTSNVVDAEYGSDRLQVDVQEGFPPNWIPCVLDAQVAEEELVLKTEPFGFSATSPPLGASLHAVCPAIGGGWNVYPVTTRTYAGGQWTLTLAIARAGTEAEDDEAYLVWGLHDLRVWRNNGAMQAISETDLRVLTWPLVTKY